MSAVDAIKFAPMGLASLLLRERLRVPLNQREYSWEDNHVTDLFTDLSSAIIDDKPVYFLGTIVLNTTEFDRPTIVDGQQRIATTAILIAAIRDYYLGRSEGKAAKSLEDEYLLNYDRSENEDKPRLTLNADDSEFFIRRILSRPGSEDRSIAGEPVRASHKKLDAAAALAEEHVTKIAQDHRDYVKQLERWISFLKDKAMVIVIRSPDAENTFKMFETLNDRGLRTTQADMLKNYLFEEAGDGIAEAQTKWSSMNSYLESLGMHEPSLTYLRHFTAATGGPLGKENFYERIRNSVRGQRQSLRFTHDLSASADDYAAILTPSHTKWNAYPDSVVSSVAQMRELGVAQIRPLMLAVAHKFTLTEAEKSFRAFVCWTVRFLIVGGMRGQRLEDAYAKAAKMVTDGEIKKHKQLREELSKVVPPDKRFESDFASATVSAQYLARYYLRAMEATITAETECPELAPIEDKQILNLEHIMPKSPGSEWPHVDEGIASAFAKRIGNLALLNSKRNTRVGNSAFSVKREAYKSSALVLTKQVFETSLPSTQWGSKEIIMRQEKLAELAVRTWPL